MRVLLAALLVTATLAGAPLGATAANGSGNEIVRTATLSLTPDQPGSVHAEVSYDLPDGLRSLSVTPDSTLTVVDAEGFRKDGNSYVWDGRTESPSLSVRVQVNRTYDGRHATDTRQGYSFVATPDWAIAPVPTMRTSWTWVGSGQVTLDRVAEIDGEGATGGEIAYLGPHETYTASAANQDFTLVVPEAATPAERPEAVLAALADASMRLQVGARDPSVFFVAAPTGVGWGPAGLEYGGSDVWVEADQRLDTPGDTWVHEYVHTRQAYEPTAATQWTIEATAVYASLLVDLEAGRIGFPAFHDTLAEGTNERYAGAVLSEPSTWDSALVPYRTGALTAANIDYGLRVGDRGSYADVLGYLNAYDGNVTQSVFLDAVAAGDRSDRVAAERWTETTATPEMWSLAEHDRAFETLPARIAMSFPATAFRVTGPTRNVSTATPPTMVAGETFTATVDVANTGGEPGNYSVLLDGPNETVERATGTLGAGENATVTLTHTFTETGTFTLTAGYRTVDVTVLPPADPVVSNVSAAATNVTAGDNVTVAVTVSNPANRPANGSIPVTLDGTEVGAVTVALPPGASTTESVEVTVPTAGRHTVSAGGQSVTVEATEPRRTAIGTPGFGVATALSALLALALSLAAAGRRR